MDGELFVIHRDIGEVQEIGIGGVLFTYVEQFCLQDNCPEKGILFSKDDFVVELPFKTVSDTYLDHFSSGQVNTRQRIILFDDLAGDHLEQLEQLILANVNIPVVENSVVMDKAVYWS